MNINGNDTGLPDPSPGPTDDGYIAVAVKSVPQDPFCCAGPDEQEDGARLHSALPFLCLLVLMAPLVQETAGLTRSQQALCWEPYKSCSSSAPMAVGRGPV